MKKSLLAAAALAAVSGAAQADVQLYGVLDVAVGTVAHQGNGDATAAGTINPVTQTTMPNTLTGMFNGGIQDSRWGIKGNEDLGNGMKAVFTLESGIDVNSGAINNNAASIAANGGSASAHTGNYLAAGQSSAAASSLSGQLFNRQAWVGLSDKNLGTLTFGRQYAPMFDIYTTYDPVQFAQLFSPLGYSGTIGGGGGATEYMRQDNSVKYVNKYGNFNYGAMYKFGNMAGNNSQGSGYSFRLGYEADRLGIQAAYQSVTDAVTGAASADQKYGSTVIQTGTANAVDLTEKNMKAWLITAKYKLSDAMTGKVGYQTYTLSAPSDPVAASAAGGYYGQTLSGVMIQLQPGASQTVHIMDIGGDYNFNQNLNLAVGYYVVNYDAYANGGLVVVNGTANTTGLKAGQAAANINYVSALLDYSFSKRTDVYLGVMTAQPGGAFAADANNSLYAVGIRHKF